MRAVVVYESLWGNTAAVARAVAEGIGGDAVALSTADADAGRVAAADLIVAGGPVFAFQLSSERARDDIRDHPQPGAPEPNLSAPSLRTWIASLPDGRTLVAAFDTRVRGPFGKGSPTILSELQSRGYRPLTRPEGFIVQGKYGPLRPGEIERARQWGEQLRDLAAEALASQ